MVQCPGELEFLKSLWGLGTEEEEGYRTGPPEPVFANVLWSPGIDSHESIAPAYVVWRAGTKNRVVVPARQAGNRFLVSLKGLQIPAQAT